jgi:cell wall-associated NlpC family hydrolase
MMKLGLFPRAILLFALFGLLITACKPKQILTNVSPPVIKPEVEKKVEAPTNASPVRIKPAVDRNIIKRYAALLNVPEHDLENDQLYAFIDEWMGVPYQAAGMSKAGVDCSGFTTLLEWEVFNTLVPRTTRLMADNVRRIYENELKEGDLVFFDIGGQQYSHVGVYLHNNKFVHASTSKGVVISNLKDPYYYKYFSRCGSARIETESLSKK